MRGNSYNSAHQPTGAHFWRSKSGLVLIAFMSIAAFYLLTEHTAHVFGALPFLLVLACPLLHLFMHGGHGHGEQAEHHQNRLGEGGRR